MKISKINYRLLLSIGILAIFSILASASWTTEKIFHYVLIGAGIAFAGYILTLVVGGLMERAVEKQKALYEKDHPVSDEFSLFGGDDLRVYVDNIQHTVTLVSFGTSRHEEKIFNDFEIGDNFFTFGGVYLMDKGHEHILYASSSIAGGFSYCELMDTPIRINNQIPPDLIFMGMGHTVILFSLMANKMVAINSTNMKSLTLSEMPSDIFGLKGTVYEEGNGVMHKDINGNKWVKRVYFCFDKQRQFVALNCDIDFGDFEIYDYDKLGIKFEGINRYSSDTSYDVTHHIEKDSVSEFIFNEPNYRKVYNVEKSTTTYYRGSDAMLEIMYENIPILNIKMCEYYDEKSFDDHNTKKITKLAYNVLRNVYPLFVRVRDLKANYTYDLKQHRYVYTGIQVVNMPFSKNDIDRLQLK